MFDNNHNLNEKIRSVFSLTQLTPQEKTYIEGHFISIYYQLNASNKRKLLHMFGTHRYLIHKFENDYTFAKHIEPILILRYDEDDVNKFISDLKACANTVGSLTKEAIAIEYKKKFVGLVYISNLIHILSYQTNILSLVNTIPCVKITNNKAHKIKKILSDDDLCVYEDYITIGVLDKDEQIIGIVDLEEIIDNYDTYTVDDLLYVSKKNNIKYLSVVALSTLLGTLISCLYSSVFNFNKEVIAILMFLRCLTDINTIIIIEDYLSQDTFNQYIFIANILLAILAAVAIVVIYKSLYYGIITFLSSIVLYSAMPIVLYRIYNQMSRNGIFIMLLVPELLIPPALHLIHKIMHTLYK